MKLTLMRPVDITFCDECGDEIKGTIVTLDNEDFCGKKSCRTKWDASTLYWRNINRIRDQKFYM